ncbi:TetR/AcrR family transcriptional regulator [Paenibacillus sp. P96]|uniref:TetR/AcrR family transcriptional regulator n=1 Tax=Paenibacillus zeirhizosphaerae TaxID=2987519 RepID=A0ABT9FT94_9BACL|nr:TetR/AcrR family transcriptional regulator [Paenibacillus sp. P96]MDP4097952.1 TetR/AcrR family transcriptional regulator [Paenibacillus sp. P96]
MRNAERSKETRTRILKSTAQLLAVSPAGDISNREVCEAAGVKAPTLYHYFDDKEALLHAVVKEAFDQYLAQKRKIERTGDLIADFKNVWDMHITFGLDNPALYDLMYCRASTHTVSPAATNARSEVMEFMRHIEDTGRLRLPINISTDLIESVATGLTFHLIRSNSNIHHPLVSITCNMLISILIGPAPSYEDQLVSPQIVEAASTLRNELSKVQISALRASETALLKEWLDILSGN